MSHPISRLHAVRPGRPAAAFTLIEMIVAVGLTALMLTLASRVFYDAQRGVEIGLQTSQVIAQARALGQPFARDIKEMHVFQSPLETNTPGFLAIVQQDFAGVRWPNTEGAVRDDINWSDEYAANDGEANEKAFDPTMVVVGGDIQMRSDQLAFFRGADDLESLVPGTAERFDSAASAPHARVWYGHVFNEDDGSNRPVALNADQPGDPNQDLSSQLTLGRQALLMLEENAGSTFPGGGLGDQTANRGARGQAAGDDVTAGLINAFNTANPTNAVFHDTLELSSLSVSGVDVNRYDDGGDDNGTLSLFRLPTHTTPMPMMPSTFGGLLGSPGGLTNPNYIDAARDWIFEGPGRRLRARTSLPEDTRFTAADLGALHAAFSPHVADFVVEFAADWEDSGDDGRPTGDPISQISGNSRWPDDEPDRDDAGNVKWYSAVRPNPDIDGDGFPEDGTRSSQPVTYVIPQEIPDASQPVMMGSGRRPLIPNPFVRTIAGPNSRTIIVFSHTGDDPIPATPGIPETRGEPELTSGSGNGADETRIIEGSGPYWPYMIRIRYRLMDGQGKLRTSDPVTSRPVVGRWFEQIIPVPRPRGLF